MDSSLTPTAADGDDVALAESLAAVAFEFGRHMTKIYGAIDTTYGSYSGSTYAVVAYFRDNPDVLDILARASADRSQYCHCFCQWTHVGDCTREAGTTRISGGLLLPLCDSCAAAIDVRRRYQLNGGDYPLPPSDLIAP